MNRKTMVIAMAIFIVFTASACNFMPKQFAEPVEFDEPINYELNPHLLNVKIYSDDELTRIMLEKERTHIRAEHPELDAFLVEKDEIEAAMEKSMAVWNAIRVDIQAGKYDWQAIEEAEEEGRKILARSKDWRARFRARYAEDFIGEDN